MPNLSHAAEQAPQVEHRQDRPGSSQARSRHVSPMPIQETLSSLGSIIPDILRTRVCIPGSLFLVESINRRISVGVRRSPQPSVRAVRLLLSDDRLCIQALLTPTAHSLIDSGRIREGMVVRLDRFRVRVVAPPGPTGHPVPPTVFLVVEEIAPAGFVLPGRGAVARALASRTALQRRVAARTPAPAIASWATGVAPQDRARSPTLRGRRGGEPLLRGAADSANVKGNAPEMRREEGGGDQAPVAIPTTADQAQRQPDVPATSTARELDSKDSLASQLAARKDTEDGPGRPDARTRATGEEASAAPTDPWLPWASANLGRPLRLTCLRDVPLLPYKQNWMVNVLAVVAGLDDPEPSPLPPYTGKQRTARLADPSTQKRVLLTVFLDPEAFAPAVGSVVLLLGVKNHRFDGGSLKKYASDRPRDGAPWWLQEPAYLDWCDVGTLRDWWMKTQQEEEEEASQ